jgi:phosphohistidine swiveling domain-containing protein
MIAVDADIRGDASVLLLPVRDMVGAIQKTESLIAELTHPNIDWKYVTTGLRNYLFDYIYDLLPHTNTVMPVVYGYLRESTLRKKASGIRACDTFFDRYILVMNKVLDGNDQFRELMSFFDSRIHDYLSLLTLLAEEKFYFENIHDRFFTFGGIVCRSGGVSGETIRALAQFIFLQYRIYMERAIIVREEEIGELHQVLKDIEGGDQLAGLLTEVSETAYLRRLGEIELLAGSNSAEIFTRGPDLADFKHNTLLWEKICLMATRFIETGEIADDGAIIHIFEFLIRKSNEGGDRNLQLFMSRTLASLCSMLVKRGSFSLLQKVILLVMPFLLEEIERGGRYASAFSTIYNIGKSVIESGNIGLIDFFEDILVRSKFSFPEISGIASDWSVIVNSSHLENIRTWMRLIEINPSLMKKLSASLIVNLQLYGVFLKDTDVFQRDISRLLNSNYRDVFYLIISLASIFPAFYHDIGATGDIRSFTERIDTNHKMDDLIHFMRKQVHVESSSQTVVLIQRIMEFWMTGKRTLLKNMVPPEVYDNLGEFFKLTNLDREEAPRTIYGEAVKHFPEHADKKIWDFLNAVDEDDFMSFVSGRAFDGVSDADKDFALRYLRLYFETRLPTEMTKILHYIKNNFAHDVSKRQIWKFLYEVPDDDFRKMFVDVGTRDFSKVNIEKFISLLHVYRLLFDKYNFTDVRVIEKLERYAGEGLFDPPADFFTIIRGADTIGALDLLLKTQLVLKDDILLSKQMFEPLDTIDLKRHVAFGIPSMYGSYKERKFDTLKVFFHMNLVRVRFFETIIEEMDLSSGSRQVYMDVKRVLKLFIRTFVIDGLANQEMLNYNNLLETPNLTLTQLRDIVTHTLTIHGEISDRFNETFKYVCREAIRNIGVERIARQYIPRDKPESIEVIIDRFVRSQIMQSPLLQLFDNFLISLKDLIVHEIGDKGDSVCLNECQRRPQWENSVGEVIRLLDDPSDPFDPYEPCDRDSYAQIHDIKKISEFHDEVDRYAPVWEIGSKAHGLLFIANMEGVNAPPGIILSSELYKRLGNAIVDDVESRQQMIYLLKRYVDKFTGNRFANPRNPQLLSVRSGAVFSMPGVMDTVTNVGMTSEILDFYARSDQWFAYDCHRRFLQDLSISFYGMERKVFENLIYDYKRDVGVDLKEKMTGEQMAELTIQYRYVIHKRGFYIPEEPYEQLLYSIVSVFRSWNSPVARRYRELVNISDDWGTAVIIQNMVFGNASPDSITGVVHSRYHGNEKIDLFGEYKTRAQGHDLVSGVARVFPISLDQKRVYRKFAHMPSMEEDFPVLYNMLFNAVQRIRDKWGNDLQIEFTIEKNTLYILQVRGMDNHIFQVEVLEESAGELEPCLLGQGLAASGSVVSGRAVFSIGRIDLLRTRYPNDKLILVRPETNPEDVVGMEKSDGILTCIGGMTSHAVLQMRRLSKSGVSDFSIMHIDEDRNQAYVEGASVRKEMVSIREGDFITIDGSTGNVYVGFHKTRELGPYVDFPGRY